MYAKTGKLISLLILPLLAVFFYLSRSKRARIIVVNEKNQILLVKTWLGHQEWSLPGGGVNIGETPQHAAERELHEETGITGVKAEFLGEQKMGNSIAKYHGLIFKANVSSDIALAPSPRHRGEIIGIQWFSKEKLPDHVAKIISSYL